MKIPQHKQRTTHMQRARTILDEPVQAVSDGPGLTQRVNLRDDRPFDPNRYRQGAIPSRDIILSGAEQNGHITFGDSKSMEDVGCTVKGLEYVSFGKETGDPPPKGVTF